MSTTTPTPPTPSAEELAALLDCFRYGDVEQGDFEDIKAFTEQYGTRWLSEVRDERGNTPLHMAGGNGHTGTSLFRSSEGWVGERRARRAGRGWEGSLGTCEGLRVLRSISGLSRG